MAELNEGLIQTQPCRYGLMSFFKNDNTISRSLAEYGEWAQAEIEFLECCLDGNDAVLDVGAYIGTHTLAFARKVGEGGMVYAFEPQPTFFELLKDNIGQNALHNVKALNVAVSDRPGRLQIADADADQTGNFGGTGLVSEGSEVEGISPARALEVITIDRLGLDKCRLIKIDAEGMEINVLRGAQATLRNKRPFVFAECNSLDNGCPVLEFSKQVNYCAYFLNVPSFNRDNYRHSGKNFFGELREAGFILVPVEQREAIHERWKLLRWASQPLPIVSVDDLALGLLKKPQYKYEVMSHTKAAEILGVDFWANEPQVKQFQDTISQKVRQIDLLSAQFTTLQRSHRNLTDELLALQRSHRDLTEELSALRAQQEQTLATLNQIYSSHGWEALSLYYKVREKLLPRKAWRRMLGRRVPRTAIEVLRLLGQMRQLGGSGLFDKQWYLRQNPDVAAAGVNPLRHYLRRGAAEGRDPNPLFDSDWYLRQNPDVAEAGVNPLWHYLRRGAVEARDPSPLFNTRRYLQENPEVMRAGVNPLAHHLRQGRAKLRRPGASASDGGPQNAAFATPHSAPTPRFPPLAPAATVRPAAEKAGISGWVHNSLKAVTSNQPALELRPLSRPPLKQSRPATPGRRLLCVTHVLPYPPRAGNEYRIHRMLDWLAGEGFEIFLVVCPLPGDSISPERLADACSAYANLFVCQRDGTLLHHMAEGNPEMKFLSDLKPRDFVKLLAEDRTAAACNLDAIVRTFCPNLLAEVVLQLDQALQPDIVLMEYIFMARPLPLMRPGALKVIDTHDVFSTKHDKILRFGVEDSLALTAEDEARLLQKADLIIAIQPDEAEELRRLAPKKPVVVAGVDFDPAEPEGRPAHPPIVLMVASDNRLNVKGLKDFLRFAWPLVRRQVPGVELHIAGSVGRQVEISHPGVKVLGLVDDLPAAYAQARVVINPAIAGTGLKVKTIEALCHFRPVVVWPSGIDGMDPELQALCQVASDWYQFARQVVTLCSSEDAIRDLAGKAELIHKIFSADAIYKDLRTAFSANRPGRNSVPAQTSAAVSENVMR